MAETENGYWNIHQTRTSNKYHTLSHWPLSTFTNTVKYSQKWQKCYSTPLTFKISIIPHKISMCDIIQPIKYNTKPLSILIHQACIISLLGTLAESFYMQLKKYIYIVTQNTLIVRSEWPVHTCQLINCFS